MCLRRRFYKGPISAVAAGKKERVLFHKGKICVRQLHLQYDADNDTGNNKNVWNIKIDGMEILNFSFLHIYQHFAGNTICNNSDRPIICSRYSDTSKIFSLIFHDLGRVEEGIEVWFENVDTSNTCYVTIGMVYDILE